MSIEHPALLTMYRVRELLIAERVDAINAMRAHAAGFGLVVAQGPRHVPTLLAVIEAADEVAVPAVVKRMLGTLAAHLQDLEARIETIDGEIHATHRANEASWLLATIPGVGVITTRAPVASIDDASQFKSARHLAAWRGLVPLENSTGGKTKLGPITKRGDPYLRKLLIHGARTVLRWRRIGVNATPGWLVELIKRKPPNVAATALAIRLQPIGRPYMDRFPTDALDPECAISAGNLARGRAFSVCGRDLTGLRKPGDKHVDDRHAAARGGAWGAPR